MSKVFAAAVLAGMLVEDASAGFTDFEDLEHGASFVVGDIIESNDVVFRVVDVFGQTTRVDVDDDFDIGAAGLQLSIETRSSGVELVLPTNSRYFSTFFAAYSPNAGVIINGEERKLAGDFDSLDGSVVGGVTMYIDPAEMPEGGRDNVQGRLTLVGNLTSLILRGDELLIDNVSIGVPEPSSQLLILCGAAAVFVVYGRKGWRRRIIQSYIRSGWWRRMAPPFGSSGTVK